MCHLILALPLFALPVFWLLPPEAAILLFVATLALTAGVYALAVIAMRKPVCTGAEDLLRAVGTVREVRGDALTIWVKSELWSAEDGDGSMAVGDAVEVLAVDGLTLRVRRVPTAGAASRPASDAGNWSH